MKILKYIFYIILLLVILALCGFGALFYKAKNGINFYETTPHVLDGKYGEQSILLISKTNGFPHWNAIEASIPIFESIAEKNNWNLYVTDDAGVFNADQLPLFDLVIYNNATGKILNPDQRELFRNYILNGGGFMGVHGAGDASHHWDFYEDTLIGAKFSHHPIEFQIQEGTLQKELHTDSSHRFNAVLPTTFKSSDEWYVFYESPRLKGAEVLYTLDETGLSMDGNLPLLASDKDFGMGDDHPIVWYKDVDKGRSFYAAFGHNANAFAPDAIHLILEEGMRWAGRL